MEFSQNFYLINKLNKTFFQKYFLYFGQFIAIKILKYITHKEVNFKFYDMKM